MAPFDHKYVEPAPEVKVTLSPLQNDIGPDAVIAGAVTEQVDKKKEYKGSFIKSVIFPYAQFVFGYRIVTGEVQLSAGYKGLLLVNVNGEMFPPINTFSGLPLAIKEPWFVEPFLMTSPVTIR